jgi:hypothetical protein
MTPPRRRSISPVMVFYHQYIHRIGFGAEADRSRARGVSVARPGRRGQASHRRGHSREVPRQIQKFFDAVVHEVRLVFNEPDRDAYLKALRAVASA